MFFFKPLAFFAMAAALLVACSQAPVPASNTVTSPSPIANTTTAPSTGTPAASPTTAAKPVAQQAGGKGVQVVVDGQQVDVKGEASRAERVTTPAPTISILSGNARGSQDFDYGVSLILQVQSGKSQLTEGFASVDVDVVTFTVYKGREFSYISAGRMPGQPVKGLTIEQTTGRLKGSYDETIAGSLGKVPAKVQFDLPFPK